MFRPGLFNIEPSGNFWPAAYALTTLNRAVRASNLPLVSAWANWAGATSWTLFTAGTNTETNFAILDDGQTKLVLIDGTRNPDQLQEQIIQSYQITAAGLTGHFHSFFYQVFCSQIKAALEAILSSWGNKPLYIWGHSLGGAAAALSANFLITNGFTGLKGLFTAGQPRVGDAVFGQAITCPWVRFIRFGDFVTNVPPDYITTGGLLAGVAPQLWPSFIYTHRGVSIRTWRTGGAEIDGFTLDTYLPIGLANTLWEWATDSRVLAPHWIVNYELDFAAGLDDSETAGPFAPLVALNGQMDMLPEETWWGDFPGTNLASAGVYQDMNVVVPSNGSLPSVPTPDRGQTVELRSMLSPVFVFGGNPFMANSFKGKDRRLLTTLLKVCNAIASRDTRVGDPKKTHTLSNRILMFPSTGSPSLFTQLSNVAGQATTLLDMENS